MQAVLLTAGKGTRMAKYYEGPKQLLPVMGKPVIEHLLDQLPAEVDELILVVGGPHEQRIRDHFKSQEWQGRPIRFVVQKEQLGLAHAFGQAKNFITGRWLGILPDDIYGVGSIQKIINEELALLAYPVANPENFGVLVVNEDGYLIRAVEKPKEFVSNLVWTGIMVMDKDFLTLMSSLQPAGNMKLLTSG